jgi:hypothetical protein
MKSTIKCGALSILLTLCIACLTFGAEEAPRKAPKVLEINKLTQKLEVRHSQIGYRNTLLFFTFNEQKTVLKLQIGNRDKTFPMTATVYIFDDSVTKDGLKKWLNNQHSDGLFPDVPRPISTLKIPATVCKVTSHKLVDNTKQPFGEYANYAVTFEVKDYADMMNIKLKRFTGETKVHVKTK